MAHVLFSSWSRQSASCHFKPCHTPLCTLKYTLFKGLFWARISWNRYTKLCAVWFPWLLPAYFDVEMKNTRQDVVLTSEITNICIFVTILMMCLRIWVMSRITDGYLFLSTWQNFTAGRGFWAFSRILHVFLYQAVVSETQEKWIVQEKEVAETLLVLSIYLRSQCKRKCTFLDPGRLTGGTGQWSLCAETKCVLGGIEKAKIQNCQWCYS